MSAEYCQIVAIDDAAYKDLHTQHQQLLEKYTVVSQQLEDLRLNLGLALPHELRTPLNSILGFSQLLIFLGPNRLPEPDQILSMQTSIYRNALRLQPLIENYLLYTQLMLTHSESARQYRERWQRKELLETKSFIRDIVLLRAEAIQRQKDLRLKLVRASIPIAENALQKIVEELLDNAFKFSEPGTLVHIRTYVSPQQWTLKITDQRRGLTAEQISNIGACMQFDRQQYEQQGLGLGLALVRLLVQLNDGEFTLDSALNRGTTVTIVFSRNTSRG